MTIADDVEFQNFSPLQNHPPGILTDSEIRRLNFIHPFSEKVQGPGIISYGLGSMGYDLRLGEKWLVLKDHGPGFVLDPLAQRKDRTEWTPMRSKDGIPLLPGESILAETSETLEMPPDVLGVILGKSSYARCFVLVNATPIEPGWRGKVTLEITNIGKTWTRLYVGMGICQILFFRADRSPEKSYFGKYQDQAGVTPAR